MRNALLNVFVALTMTRFFTPKKSYKLTEKIWVGLTSVSDPYHFDTDPDPGCEKICYGSGSSKKGQSTRKIFKKG